MKTTLLWGAALCALLVFMGCPDDGGSTDKRTEGEKGTDSVEFEGKILKVTGIPADVPVIAAFLISEEGMTTTRAPEASAFNVLEGTTGNFDLYTATPQYVPSTTPWNGSGGYYLGLAWGSNMTEVMSNPQYFYTEGKEVLEFNLEGFKEAVQKDIEEYMAQSQQGPGDGDGDEEEEEEEEGDGDEEPTPSKIGIQDLLPTAPDQQPDAEKIGAYIQQTIQGLGQNSVINNMAKYTFSEKTSTIAWDQFKQFDPDPSKAEAAATAVITAAQNDIAEALTELLTALAAQLAQMQGGGG